MAVEGAERRLREAGPVPGVHARADLPEAPSSVRQARSLVRTVLREWHLHCCEDTATMLVSELASNAVLHAQTPFAVEVTRTDRVVRVSVSDCSDIAPALRRPGPTAGAGRGLAMVAQLSCAWGTGDGVRPYAKTVWFEVPLSG